MSLESLPPELQLQIVELLDQPSLKSLRLTSKWIHPLATAGLFCTVYIRPSTRSLACARNVSNVSRLAEHVRALVYRIDVVREFEYQIFHHFILEDHVRAISPDHALSRYLCYREEVKAQQEFRHLHKEKELWNICVNFPHLQHAVIEDCKAAFDAYFPYMNPAQNHPEYTEDFHFSILLKATSSNHLLHVSDDPIDWRDLIFAANFLSDSHTMLGRLRNLYIGFNNVDFDNLDISHDGHREQAVSTLTRLLGATTNLSYLRLDLGCVLYGRVQEDQENQAEHVDSAVTLVISRCMFVHEWRHLRRLDLAGLVLVEEEFVDFLSQRARTVRQLRLCEIAVYSEPSEPASILSLFEQISRLTALDSVRLEGHFTNSFDQAWWADPYARQPDSLVCRLEQWMCQKGFNPLPAGVHYRRRQPPFIYD